MNETVTTEQQRWVVGSFVKQYGISEDDVYFLDERNPLKEWLAPNARILIARKSGQFQSISETFLRFEVNLNEVIHTATVIDTRGFKVERIGIATVGEKVNGKSIDSHLLAGNRAIGAALASFDEPIESVNPKKYSDYYSIIRDKNPLLNTDILDRTMRRLTENKQIHGLAEKVGLISDKDRTPYYFWLEQTFDVKTTKVLGPTERLSVIHELQQLDKLSPEEKASFIRNLRELMTSPIYDAEIVSSNNTELFVEQR